MTDQQTAIAPSCPPKVVAIEAAAMAAYREKYPDGPPWQKLHPGARHMWVNHIEKKDRHD